jgi:riboflavin biosynthesis pyrimidine reductase
MMDGSGLIASFLDAGEIDEFMIHVVPVFIGRGIALIEPGNVRRSWNCSPQTVSPTEWYGFTTGFFRPPR